MRRATYAACCFVLAVGCKGRSLQSRPAPPSEIASLEGGLALVEARRLAFAPTDGQAPVDKRLVDLVKVARLQPRKLETWILLGRAWVWKARESSDPGYYLNAKACADLALDLSPGNSLALGLRALVLLNDHEFAEARALAQSLVDADPADPMAWGSLSDALFELGDLERADRAAQTMMDLKPSLPAYTRASYFQWLAGDVRGAVESARLAIDAGGDRDNAEPRAWSLVQAAMLFWHVGDYDGADAGFEQALAVIRDYPPALVGRGRVAMAHGDASWAVDFFRRAHERSPLVETAWLLGDALEAKGDETGAGAIFARAERDGTRTDRRTLSLLYSTRDEKPHEALRLAEEERATRGDPYTDDALAWALYRNGRYDEARTAIDRARRYGTNDARLLFHQGAIYVASGDRAKGRKLVARALAQNPKFDRRGEAEARKLLASR
jgi:tetratricopeptide (TPR) repeat protein